jgi:hypothetical protein
LLIGVSDKIKGRNPENAVKTWKGGRTEGERDIKTWGYRGGEKNLKRF